MNTAQTKQLEIHAKKLKELTDQLGFPFEKAWAEFIKRCDSTAFKPALELKDLMWEIEAGRWPKKKK